MINKNDAIKKRLATLDNTNTLEDEKTSLLKEIKQLIPNLVNADNVLNMSALEDLIELSNTTANNQGYELTFAGKGLAKAKAEIATDKELKVELAQSKNFDDTENIIIRGDNLDVLKILKQNYYEKVKMIYIDPPYNTSSDNFIYNDDFREKEQDLIEKFGLPETTIDYLQNIYGTKTHSGWLSFMYPRLKLARDLLTEDGVIFISIDDKECANLKIICDEIFGEENFVAQVIVQTNPRGRTFDKFIAKTHEYAIVYTKSFDCDCLYQIPKDGKAIAEYRKRDDNGNYRLLELRNRNPVFNRTNRPNMFYPFYADPHTFEVSLTQSKKYSVEIYPRNSQDEDGCWTWGLSKARNEISILVANHANTGKWTVFRKDYLEGTSLLTKSKSLWLDKKINHENGKEVLGDLFGRTPFDFPKSLEYIKKCLHLGTNKDNPDIILDFFAGSGTTAHAVMDLNKEDGGTRKFILVQWDEKIDEKKSKPAYDFCIKNTFEPVISSITIERVNRAGEKLKQEAGLLADNLDIGYKVFSLMDKTRINIQDDQHSLITQRTNTLETLYNMMVATSQPLHSKIEEIEKDALYKIKNSYYVINSFKINIETLKDSQVYIDAYSNISLEQYLNFDILQRENISVVY